MRNKLIIFTALCVLTSVLLGCGKAADNEADTAGGSVSQMPTQIEVVTEGSEKEGPGFSEADADSVVNSDAEIGGISEETLADDPVTSDPETADSNLAEAKDNEKETEGEANTNTNAQPIVWLGDSLTQGSLGDDSDNLPNAPYERLKKKVSVPVEGYGLYGYKTHDIFWVYRDEAHYNQEIDPNKTYIFWVGSCDWCPDEGPNSNTAPVIAEIDGFLAQNGGVKNYIVIGTTNRWRLGDLYIPINQALSAHYGSHYMDVIDIIKQNGFSPDNTHLSQASYDAIADAVYSKLKSLGYI